MYGTERTYLFTMRRNMLKTHILHIKCLLQNYTKIAKNNNKKINNISFLPKYVISRNIEKYLWLHLQILKLLNMNKKNKRMWPSS